MTHAVIATKDVVISGGKEGKVKFWTIDLMQCLKEVEINHPQAMSGCIKAMHLSGSMLILGTRTGEIYEMDTTSYTYTLMLQGHGYGTVWGLATHPGSIRCAPWATTAPCAWDVASRRMVMVRDLGAKGRSVAYHPDGSQIAIGLAGGGLVVLSADSLDTIHAKKDRRSPYTSSSTRRTVSTWAWVRTIITSTCTTWASSTDAWGSRRVTRATSGT